MRFLTALSVCFLAFLASAWSDQQNLLASARGLETHSQILQKRMLVSRSPSGRGSDSGRQHGRGRDQARDPSGTTARGGSTASGNAGVSANPAGGVSTQAQTARSRNPSGNQGRGRGNPDPRSPMDVGRSQNNPQFPRPSSRYMRDMSRNSASPAVRVFNPTINPLLPPPYIVPNAETPLGFGYQEHARPPPVMSYAATSMGQIHQMPRNPHHRWPDTRVETTATGPGRFHADGGFFRVHEPLAPQWVGSKVADNPVRVVGGGEMIGHGRVTTRVSGRKASVIVDPGPGGSAKVRYAVPAGTAEATVIHPASAKFRIHSENNVPVVLETESLGTADIWSSASNSPPRPRGSTSSGVDGRSW